MVTTRAPNILSFMSHLDVSSLDMDTPFTLDRKGLPVTLREYLHLCSLGEGGSVLSPLELGTTEEGRKFLKNRTIEGIARMPWNQVICIGRQVYSPDDLIKEVEGDTEVGLHQVSAAHGYLRLLEGAVLAGKIREVPNRK